MIRINNNYLARETGGCKKSWNNRLPVALVFPNVYAVGMSNLGFQSVYRLLNDCPEIVAERFFFPDSAGAPRSIESRRPLADFPLILFSISFEQDYLHLIRLLLLGGIPPLAADRDQGGGRISSLAAGGQPLLVAGGVATFINPEPLAPYIDLFMIGEAEALLPAILADLPQKINDLPKTALLEKLATSHQGCYVPRFYEVEYDTDGTDGRLTARTAAAGLPTRIKKPVLSTPTVAGHSQIMTPDAEFADMFVTELGRGCSRGCRFCAAAYVYRPPRRWPAAAIIRALSQRPAGINRIGLLGMEMAAMEDLAAISDYLLEESCALSFSSLRADAISPALIRLLARSGLKSAAIAPDGGSARLRRLINKGLDEDDLLAAAESLVRVGVVNLKLYFMIGLPTETMEDMEELVALTLRIKQRILTFGKSVGRLANLLLSVNCLIPKPWTPLQFHPFADGSEQPVKDLKNKINFLRKALGPEPNIKIRAERPENALYQAVLARGDRRTGTALLALARSDANWRQIFKLQGIIPEKSASRMRGRHELFPWEIIDHGIKKDYLWAEYQRALTGRKTAGCDPAGCKRCGVCG